MSDVLDRLRSALADRYTIEGELGSGGMAVVYLAQDDRLERRVAVKVLRPELTSVVAAERFLREIKLTANLHHPHILPLHDSGKADGLLYYVMPYVKGESLRRRLEREGRLPVEEAVRIAREVADALSYAHERDLLHRDIKPENILLEAGHAVVADFGIARALSEAGADGLTGTGVTIGTPAYMSPEQAAGERALSEASDLYSLACVLYEMLTGEPPVTDPSVRKVVSRKLLGEFRPLSEVRPEVPPEVDAAVSRGLATEPAERFPTAGEFAKALEPVGERADRRIRLARVIGLYAAASVAVLATAYFLMLQLGLPDWFFSGAAFVLLVCLPIIVATALVQGAGVPGESEVAGSKAPPAGPRRWLTWRNAIAAGVALFALLGTAGAGYAGMRAMGIGSVGSLVAAGVLEERERVVLADFENETGDSALTIAVTEAFRTDLAQSPIVTLLTPAQVNRALERMLQERTAILDTDLAREIAIREGLKAVIAGSVSSAGSGYILSTRLLKAEDGESIVAYRETAADSSEVIAAIDRLSARLRERMGESLKSIRGNEPLEQVTTGSLEALKKHSQASRLAFGLGDYERAIPAWEDAIALDSGFAAAYQGLGTVRFNRGEQARAVEAMSKAYELREGLTERERYDVIGLYHLLVDGDVDRAMHAYRMLVEISDSTAGLNNLAVLYTYLRDHERSEELMQRALLEADSLSTLAYVNLFDDQVLLGRFDEARRTLERSGEKLPSSYWQLQRLADLAAYRGDYATAKEHIQARGEAGDTPDERLRAQALAGSMRANLALLQGKLSDARRHYYDAVTTEERRSGSGGFSNIFGYSTSLALLHAWFRGDSATGSRLLEEVLERHPLSAMAPLDRPYLQLAEYYAVAGAPREARAMLEEYERVIDPTLRSFLERPRLHRVAGAVVLAEGDHREAIRLMRLGDEGVCVPCGVALLGRAYDLAGKADSAVTAYERYLARPAAGRTLLRSNGLELRDPFWLPVVYERLGALYAERGEPTKAIRYYGKLIELWKDADPELQPRVEAARRAIEAHLPDR